MIKTKEVIEDSEHTLEFYIEEVIKEEDIVKGMLIDIKYNKRKHVEPYYDDDGYLNKDGHNTVTTTSALIIWDDMK